MPTFLMQLKQCLPSLPKLKNELKCGATCASFAECLIVFAIVEGIFFSGSFCAVFWFQQCGILAGLCFANKLISRPQ
jgi:ribonucleotide reductase beta subunit family protein with ferritin-like domain